jgi:site-specific recombinase XerD
MNKPLVLKQFVEDLQIRNFSDRTIGSYIFQLNQFLDYYQSVPQALDISKIREYLLFLKTERKYSSSSLNVAYSVIQIFFERILQLEWPSKSLGRPKVANKLPQIFTQDEIKRLLSGIINLKHKAVLSLMYSSGLRVSEIIHLTPESIDSKQMYVMVRGGKSQKDRTTLLSATCLCLLRKYFLAYRPEKYLFNGQKKASPLSETSIRCVLKKAVKKAGITKKVSLHTLRHSFATHLLENGTNIFYIKELLGHKSIKTTMVYLHLCSKDIRKFESPLDKLFSQEVL